MAFDVFLEAGKIGLEKEFQIKFPVEMACPACGGEGWAHSGVCSLCRGRGYLLKDISLAIKIPDWVREGLIQSVTYSDDLGNDYFIRIIYHIR